MGDADNSTRPPGKAGGGGEVPPAAAPETPPEEDQTKKLKLNGDAVAEEAAAPLVSTTSTDDATMEQDEPSKDDCNNKEEVKEDPPEKKEEVKEEEPPPPLLPEIKVTVMYNKNPLSVEISPSCTVLELKKRIQTHTSVDPSLQKVLLKGIAKDDAKLVDLGVSAATKKILVIGSSIQEVLAVKEVPTESLGGGGSGGSGSQADSSTNWCSVQAHKKVIDKGLPEDVMPGILDENDPLPPFPLHGMYSSKGSKVRLTFKLENDELWIGTKERTEKVPIGTIRAVTSQAITGYEHYHIVAIQLGPTEASRFFVYWVPAQYVEAIKDALTGA